MAFSESARAKVDVTLNNPVVSTPRKASARGQVNVTFADPNPASIRSESLRAKVNVTIVSPRASNRKESPRGKTEVTINKRIGVLFWTVENGVKIPLFAFNRPTVPPVDPGNPLPLGISARGTVDIRIGADPVETRDPTLWAYAQIGPANSPRGSGAQFAPLNDERTLALRGGVTVSSAGVSRTINTNMGINSAQWSVGVNIADANDPTWTLTGDGAPETLTPKIPSPPVRSAETGNGDFLTELIQPDGTSYSVYKFGYGQLDTTNRRASFRSGAWNKTDLRKSGGISDDPTSPQYHRGPRATQVPALFGLMRKWELEKAISGDWQNALRHTLAVATQGHAIKRGSMNNGISQIWPAFGSDYHGDRATQVLDPPASGNFTLTSTVAGTTRATTQPWNVAVATLQSAIRSWGGDYGSVAVTGTAGSSYSISSVRTNANTFKVTGGTITAPGTTYANTGMPVGQYFVVDPGLNIESLPIIHPVSKAIALALQDFGGYVVDMSSVMVVYAEVGAAGILAPFMSQIVKDLAYVRPHFLAVTNNTEANLHGGGTPVRELAPPFIL